MTVKFRHPELGEFVMSILPEGMVVGRTGGEADIELHGDDKMSRKHGRLWLQDGDVWYEDLGSSNGSWLGALRVTAPVKLTPDQEVRLGDTYVGLSEKPPEKPFHSSRPPNFGSTQQVKASFVQEILAKHAAQDKADPAEPPPST